MTNVKIIYGNVFNIWSAIPVLIFYIILNTSLVISQQVSVINPSFEDTPADATIPMGWMACEDFTTPDILPGYWGVYNDASDGETFIGLITREDGSFEAIGQRLSSKLLTGECYGFKIDVAHSNAYSGYNEAVKFKIYLSNQKCERQHLVYKSEIISNTEWETITIKFTAKTNLEYILIEVQSIDGRRQKGNILFDHMTPIFMCNRA